MTMPDRTLREVVERATYHYWSDLARARGSVRDEPDLGWFLTGWPSAALNRITWTRLPAGEAADRIARVRAELAERALPFRWYVTDDSEPSDLGDRLVAAGFVRQGSSVPMAVDLDRLPPVPDHPGIDVRQVSGPDEHRDFCDVVDTVFFPTAGQPFRSLELAVPPSVLAQRPRYVAYAGDSPVATSVLVCEDGVAGVYAIGTLPEWRRHGLGALMTLHALHAARAGGYATGILHASAMGAPVYARLGFAAIGSHDFYEAPDIRVN